MQNSFFTAVITEIKCNVTVLVENTWVNPIVMRAGDMNKAKKDVLTVKYLLNGKVCGVLAVDVY